MSRSPSPSWETEERRNARIRQLRQQREGPVRRRRRFQPVALVVWFAGVIALLGVVLLIGFVAFAPRLMSWAEQNPHAIDNGLVRDFVQWYQPDALKDTPASSSAQRIAFEVPTGASDTRIAQLLYDKGLIHSQLAFVYWVLQAGRQGSLQAGVYDLSPSLTPTQIIAALRQERGPELTIRIREGWRLEEIAAYLSTTRLTMNLSEFVTLVRTPPADLLNKYALFKDLPRGRSLEGYLYPDTYRVDGNISARQLVEKLLGNFDAKLTPALRQKIATQQVNGSPMTIDQAVIIASIVEREAVLDKERPLIAGVYVNRLAAGNRETSGLLNADPTLQYGLATAKDGKAPIGQWAQITWWPPLPDAGAKITLPAALAGYQSYVNPGLPPSPIAAPRIASIAAVAAADTASGYYYFVAACPGGKRDGSHYFGKSLAEQSANIAKSNAECPAA